MAAMKWVEPTRALAVLGGEAEVPGRAAVPAKIAATSCSNYAFQVGLKPHPSAQQMTVAVSFSDKIVLKVQK